MVCFRNKIYVYTLPVVDICKLIYLPYPMILQVPGANCQFPPDMNYLFCLLCFQLVDCDKTIILYFFYKSGITESFLLNFFYILFLFFFFFFYYLNWIFLKLCSIKSSQKGCGIYAKDGCWCVITSPWWDLHRIKRLQICKGANQVQLANQSLQCLQVSLWGLRTW